MPNREVMRFDTGAIVSGVVGTLRAINSFSTALNESARWGLSKLKAIKSDPPPRSEIAPKVPDQKLASAKLTVNTSGLDAAPAPATNVPSAPARQAQPTNDSDEQAPPDRCLDCEKNAGHGMQNPGGPGGLMGGCGPDGRGCGGGGGAWGGLGIGGRGMQNPGVPGGSMGRCGPNGGGCGGGDGDGGGEGEGDGDGGGGGENEGLGGPAGKDDAGKETKGANEKYGVPYSAKIRGAISNCLMHPIAGGGCLVQSVAHCVLEPGKDQGDIDVSFNDAGGKTFKATYFIPSDFESKRAAGKAAPDLAVLKLSADACKSISAPPMPVCKAFDAKARFEFSSHKLGKTFEIAPASGRGVLVSNLSVEFAEKGGKRFAQGGDSGGPLVQGGKCLAGALSAGINNTNRVAFTAGSEGLSVLRALIARAGGAGEGPAGNEKGGNRLAARNSQPEMPRHQAGDPGGEGMVAPAPRPQSGHQSEPKQQRSTMNQGGVH